MAWKTLLEGKNIIRTSDTPSERKNQCGHRRDERSKVLKVNVNFVVSVFNERVPVDCAHSVVGFG